MGKKNLTLRYTLTQFTFWAASTGAASFATTYLLGCGVPSGVIGILLAAAGLLSCLTQPILAGIADKSKGFIVLKMMIGMSFLCVLCFSVQLIPSVPVVITSYGFMHPTQVYYANAKVAPEDMVKGQAFSTAAYALGCSAGNFAGGQLLSLGVEAILFAGIVMTLVGTIIIFTTVTKKDTMKVIPYEAN